MKTEVRFLNVERANTENLNRPLHDLDANTDDLYSLIAELTERVVELEEGGGGGSGDMLKSVYDTDDNGMVDNSDASQQSSMVRGGEPAEEFDAYRLLEMEGDISSLQEGSNIIVPVGGIIMWTAADVPVPPAGSWLLCNGQAVSRDDYSDLFSVIGTTFGSGNGTTTFNVPHLSGRFPIGVGQRGLMEPLFELADVGGEYEVSLDESELPEHSHDIKGTDNSTVGSFPNLVIISSGNRTQNKDSSTEASGDGESHENTPPYIAVHFIIKA